MRIVSGIYKNQALATPGEGTHPMGERERNALFNSLGSLANLTVLDLFAGSGALGFEALSRGAQKVTFVENFSQAVKTLRQNAQNLHIPPEKIEIIKTDALKFTSQTSQTYDIVFVDPPYSLAPQIDFSIFKTLLSQKSTVVFSLPKTENMALPPFYYVLSDRTYANCRLVLANI